MAIGLGFEAIRYGLQDVMLCGGGDELHPMVPGTFDLVQAASCGYNDRPDQTPRPFDKDRDGTVCGEGAGMLVLESEASATARGAMILAEVVGFGTGCDGQHLAQPRKESIVRCLNNALDNAGLLPDGIGYINAHGTGTVLGDAAEAQAIGEVFGACGTPDSSLKGHMGHAMGASGALESIACVDMLRGNYVLPTRNLAEPEEESCAGLNLIRESGCRPVALPSGSPLRVLLKSSFAFGGANTVLVLKRYPDE
jgi:3-oxoacyl-[acyl-carrier-protein] synthase II